MHLAIISLGQLRAERVMKLKMAVYTKWILVLSLCFAVACPFPSYAAEEEFTSPAQYRRQSVWDAITSLLDDTDPMTTYLLLIPFTLERILALRQLISQIPMAWRAFRDMQKYPKARKELKELNLTLEKLKEEKPILFERLKEKSKLHINLVRELEQHLLKIKRVNRRGFEFYDGSLDSVLESWEKERDIQPLERWSRLEEYRNDPYFLKNMGRELYKNWPRERRKEAWKSQEMTEFDYLRQKANEWFEEFDRLREAETQSAREMISVANQLTQEFNKQIPLDERYPILDHEDNHGRHLPGKVFLPGTNRGAVRIDSGDIQKIMEDRCEAGFAALGSRAGSAAMRGTWWGMGIKAGTIGIPLFTAGTAVAMIGLTTRAYLRTKEIYGKDPTEARRLEKHRQQVETEISVRAEGSLAGQIAKHPEGIAPFTEAVISDLILNKDKILARATAIAGQHPEMTFRAEDKEMIFSDRKNLEYQILRALPFAASLHVSSGEEMSYEQFKKFLATAPNDPSGRTTTHAFLGDVYDQVLDNLFPELDRTAVTAAGVQRLRPSLQIGSEGLRGQLIQQTLPNLEALEIKYQPNLPDHPSIPSQVK